MFVVRTAVFVLHLTVLLLVLGVKLNAYIPPKWLGVVNLLSLAFPILVVLHFVFTVFWLIYFRKRSILFLLSWYFLLAPIQGWINYHSPRDETADFKVLSYNTKGVSEEKARFLNHQNADILMLQESGWGERKKMNIPNYQYRVNSEVVSIYSKFPIIRQEKIVLPKNGYALYADIQIRGKNIRFMNIYLEPFRLDKAMVKPSMNQEINEMKAKSLLSRLMPVFKIHQNQIEEIKTFIENSPYPVVLAGDLNAVPNSYEYFQFTDLLTDVFAKVGNGSGTSFHDYKFPIRIDYIFASPSLKPTSYSVNREVDFSDHFPIDAEFSISEE
ncbi:MAG: endonuclease/exonuclease/phosphatase family protein [Flavobacteriaceae bacterium]|nr:endonuclease/exonuclease/phosphatase family protein [Flavobacteriaceae bacterium]